MKIATLILSLFMFFKPVLPVLEYVVLYDYIKNELCVNKDKPELACNGKCHLVKELKHASDSNTDKNRIQFASAEIQLMYYQAIEVFNGIFSNPFHLNITERIEDQYTFSFSTFLFRPPVYSVQEVLAKVT